jgi:RNA polymerase sigma-B factor
MPRQQKEYTAAPAPVSPESPEMLARFRAYRATRSLALRDQITAEFLPLVYHAAKRFSMLGEPLDDIIQEGTIGLLHALEMYDPELGVKFSTYASHLIVGQIRHYLRDCGHLIRQPAWVQELDTKITHVTRELAQTLTREPTTAEVAEQLNLTEDAVREILAARELTKNVSLSTSADSEEDTEQFVVDLEKIHSKRYETLRLPIEDRIVLEQAISRLKQVEQQVVRMFFFGELNKSEIARHLGISTHYSSYVLRSSVEKIKANLTQMRQDEAGLLPREEERRTSFADFCPLSGVRVLAFLRALLERKIAQHAQRPTSFSLLLIAIDELASGEEQPAILTVIGYLLRSSTHSNDVAAYMGHGRFLLFLPHTDLHATTVGNRLAKLLTQRAPYATWLPRVTVRMGYTLFPADGATVEQLIAHAEAQITPGTNI